jgi:hypothetical protein
MNGDGAALFASLQVDHADRAAAELRDKQASPVQVDREVVHPAFDRAEGGLAST